MDQNNFLDQLNDDIQWSIGRVTGSFQPVADEILNFKRNPKKWSAAQCLEHILVTNELYLKKLQAISVPPRARLNSRKNIIRHGFIGKLILKVIDPQTTYQFPSPQLFKPKRKTFDRNLILKFLAHQNELSETFESFREVDLNKIKISSPASMLVRLTLADAFQLIIVHQKRHINQGLESLHLAKENQLN